MLLIDLFCKAKSLTSKMHISYYILILVLPIEKKRKIRKEKKNKKKFLVNSQVQVPQLFCCINNYDHDYLLMEIISIHIYCLNN